jgi:iron complex transport system ATP-binding protein
VEDILLQHEELTNASLFQFNENFVAPSISAPDFYKEMLYSLLQKNFQKDLSAFNFEFQNGFWIIAKDNWRHQCESFEEIVNFIKNLH